mmetsp:Transcript_45265/g.137235  ORF Transcript_45265/g.137235 Transcript_45265/m.137235 type:complete len:523 (-) Transcript_45265:442-2010(-)
MAMLKLQVWFHPSMVLPVSIPEKDLIFEVSKDMKVYELMEEVEVFFEELTETAGKPHELQIAVLWNVKDHKKALNPNEPLAMHFEDGDKFGVHGDVEPLRVVPKPKAEEDKIPVTILTGFLGSGKTTLLNYILQEQQEKKIAIIENEFGEISIDDALLKQDKLNMAEKIVVMDNGCMCCTIRGDLVRGLQQILDDIKSGGQIDHVMIETTGMADPVPIVRTFMSNPEMTRDLRLDAVIAMADAKNLPGRLDDQVEEGKVNEAYQQIAFADKIILNKLDLITTDQAIATKDRVREINKYAKVVGAVKGRVKMQELVNIRAHDMCNFVNSDIEKEAVASMEVAHGHSDNGGHGGHVGGHNGHGDGHGDGQGHDGGAEEHGHGSHVGHGDHDGGPGAGHGTSHGDGHGGGHGLGHGKKGENRHDTRVNSFAIVREGEVSPKTLSEWMALLGNLPPERGTIFRIKAILAVKGHPYKHVFHAVMDVSDEDDAGPWAVGERRLCKIVFIGKSLDQQWLRTRFEALFDE